MNPESRSSLPGIAFSGFTSRYAEPTTDEGFADITKVEFKVCVYAPPLHFSFFTSISTLHMRLGDGRGEIPFNFTLHKTSDFLILIL